MNKVNIILVTLVVILAASTGYFAYRNWQASQGDVNHDGKTNALDLSKLLSNYNKKD